MASSTASSAEPDCVDFPFAGWIPTASGRLSFRHVGETQHPTPSKWANVAANSRRLVLCYQRRPLSDAKFRPLVHFLFKRTGDFWFVLACHSEDPPGDENKLVGRIYFYKSKKDWRGHTEDYVRTRVRSLQRDGISMDNTHKQRCENHYVEACTNLDDTADGSVKFVLMRTGDVFFSTPTLRDKELEKRSIENATRWGRNFLKDIADQMYFFLRDITHKHQHHPAEDDTVIILQEHDREGIAWRKRILFSLYYYIIGAKREHKPLSQARALGILSYAISFRENCCRQFASQPAVFPVFNTDSLRSSIEAQIREEEIKEEFRQYKESARILRSGATRNYTLSIVAIVLALMAILVQPHINGDERKAFPQLYDASVFVTQHFPRIAEIVLATFLFVWLSTSSRILQWTFGRDVLELSNTRRSRSIPTTLAIALAIFALTCFVEWHLIARFILVVTAFIRTLL